MSIDTKFNLGDKVWYIIDQRIDTKVDCEICNNTGLVYIKDEEFNCPKCHGKGYIRFMQTSYKKVRGPFEVGRIDVTVCNVMEYFNLERYQLNTIDITSSAKIGSGIYIQAEDLFATEEEAIEKANTVF